ncbi:MAG: serine protease [Spirochaetaceae bacterium]|nr:serine protease [Spirochaetaceae bacterium]
MRRFVTSAVAVVALACAAAYPQQSTATSVFSSVAPAVVFVEAGPGSGSGLLLDSNTILTAAHVLYPHRSARIVFPDGTELLDVPLIAWNLLTDIAVLGPVRLDSPPAPPPFDTSATLPVGAELFAIGYPGEVESFPQPTISRGILSRYRLWSDQHVTFLQTDAAVDGGQSGGVLASAAGAVVGMTGFASDFGHFGMAISAADLLPRVTALLTGEDVPGRRGDQNLAATAQATPIRFDLDYLWAKQAFAIVAPPDDHVAFTLQSVSDLAVAIVDWTGFIISEVDEHGTAGTESISAGLDGVPPFLLLVEQFDDRNVLVRVEGDVPLVPLNDPDDGAILVPPVRRVGAIDYPYDLDYYLLSLQAGESVRVLVDSLLTDPLLSIDYRHAPDSTVDDDSGGGLFGVNPELFFRAEVDRVYRIVIDDPSGEVGGYTLSIERPMGETDH